LLSLITTIGHSWSWVFPIVVDIATIAVATVFVTTIKILLPLLLLVITVIVTLVVIVTVGHWHCSHLIGSCRAVIHEQKPFVEK